MYFKRHCSGEQAPALRNKKDNFYFILFILLTAKVYAKPVLKIFALAVYGDAFFCSRQIFVRRPFQSGKDFAFKSFYFSLAQNSSSQLSSKRSEEHTSELQSRFDLVCRLLLEKKKLL